MSTTGNDSLPVVDILEQSVPTYNLYDIIYYYILYLLYDTFCRI